MSHMILSILVAALFAGFTAAIQAVQAAAPALQITCQAEADATPTVAWSSENILAENNTELVLGIPVGTKHLALSSPSHALRVPVPACTLAAAAAGQALRLDVHVAGPEDSAAQPMLDARLYPAHGMGACSLGGQAHVAAHVDLSTPVHIELHSMPVLPTLPVHERTQGVPYPGQAKLSADESGQAMLGKDNQPVKAVDVDAAEPGFFRKYAYIIIPVMLVVMCMGGGDDGKGK